METFAIIYVLTLITLMAAFIIFGIVYASKQINKYISQKENELNDSNSSK